MESLTIEPRPESKHVGGAVVGGLPRERIDLVPKLNPESDRRDQAKEDGERAGVYGRLGEVHPVRLEPRELLGVEREACEEGREPGDDAEKGREEECRGTERKLVREMIQEVGRDRGELVDGREDGRERGFLARR